MAIHYMGDGFGPMRTAASTQHPPRATGWQADGHPAVRPQTELLPHT